MSGRTGQQDERGAAGGAGSRHVEELAARLDDEAAGTAGLDEGARRTLDQLQALRRALREAGPARASDGFADRVLARLEETHRTAQVIELRARRDRVFVMLQAASLAALLLTYGALLSLTRVRSVAPRWDEKAAAETERPAAGAAWDGVPEARVARFARVPERALRISVASLARLALDCPPPLSGEGAKGWNSRYSASRMSDSSASTTRTRTS
jgi:hypothetical protein